MKKTVVLGSIILALTAGSAYAVDHINDSRGHDGGTAAHQSQTVKSGTNNAGDGYDEYGRPTVYIPGRLNYKSGNKKYTLQEMKDIATH